MKKLFTLFIVMGVLVANAQLVNKGGGIFNANLGNAPVVNVLDNNKAVGDTLFFFDGNQFFINPTDAGTWAYENEDLDGLVPANGSDPGSFNFYYDTTGRIDWMMPGDIDTAFFMGATSWFSPAAQADNWFEFGPITLLAGAEMSWYQRYNGSDGTPPFWFDGYEVLVSTTGMTNYGSFTDAPIFTRADYTGTNGTDSSWMLQTVVIPSSYANQPCYFAFHHNANDMDVLYLDNIVITEELAGINENETNVAFIQNTPNPAKDYTVISYQLNNSGNVSLQVNDITGRVVFDQNFGTQTAGNNKYTLNTSALMPGIYVYTLTVDNNRVVNKMTIVK